ncbi:MAG: hypothetical protein ACR2IV_17485 [Bryobacteraceae bacterium]
MPKQNERDRRLVKLWLEQPTEKRTMNDLLPFYGRLQQTNPELLPPASHGDPYQQMKSVLSAYITPEAHRVQADHDGPVLEKTPE